MNPTGGKSLFYSFKLEGLGGNVKAATNVVEAKYFRPINHKRNVLAFHFVGAFATGYGNRVVPPFERLFLGGEQDLRGFDIRTVTPIAFIPIGDRYIICVSRSDPPRYRGQRHRALHSRHTRAHF